MFCRKCGKEIDNNSTTCTGCGSQITPFEIGEKDWATTLILTVFMGLFGIHRFYTGYTAIGIAQALTLGGCGIWVLIDFVYICANKYKDSEGKCLKNYIHTLGRGYMILMLAFILLFLLVTIALIIPSIIGRIS